MGWTFFFFTKCPLRNTLLDSIRNSCDVFKHGFDPPPFLNTVKKTAGVVNRYISGEFCHSLLSLITLDHCGVLSEINIPSQPRTSCSRACSGRLHFHQCVGYTFGVTFLHFVFGWTGPQPSIIGGNCSAQFRIHTWIYRWMTSGDISRNLLPVFTPNYDWKVSPCENGGITSLKMSRISFYWNIHKATIFSAVCTWELNAISVLDTEVEEVLWRRCPIGIYTFKFSFDTGISLFPNGPLSNWELSRTINNIYPKG